ncbi:hypothetical protein F4780DRAFT_31177 [Xylariomycetidae sp. FL0641]|nr:hypothetical protein F4780DRAFT_31177 [Xylariomycetidae sp. FL0641]
MLHLLPVEVLDNVAHALADTRSMCHLRLSCRQIYHKTLRIFGEMYFRTMLFGPSTRSLTRMKWVADHEVFRLAVRRIAIGIPYCDTMPCPRGYEYVDTWTTTRQSILSVLDLLQYILKRRIVNCRAAALEQLDSSFNPSMEGGSELFKLIWNALAPVPFTSLCLDAPSMHAFSDLPATGNSPPIRPGLRVDHLRTLHLSLRTCDPPSQSAAALIASATNLRSLVLSHQYGYPDDSTISCVDQLTRCASLPPLAKIHLELSYFDPGLLPSFLARFKHSLTDLQIYNVTCVDDDWTDLFQRLGTEFNVIQRITLANLCSTPELAKAVFWFRSDNLLDGIEQQHFQFQERTTSFSHLPLVDAVRYQGQQPELQKAMTLLSAAYFRESQVAELLELPVQSHSARPAMPECWRKQLVDSFDNKFHDFGQDDLFDYHGSSCLLGAMARAGLP